MKVTEKRILSKVNRKRKPITSLVQLANELEVNTAFTRSDGTTGHSAPASFRTKVLNTVGPYTYDRIRDASKVRAA